MNSSFTCHFSRSRGAAGLLTVLFTSLPACGLFSIEPEEIDIADDEAGDEASDVGDETGAFDSTGTSDPNTAGTDSTGDGDGDTSDGSTGDTSDTAAESGTTSDTGTTNDTGMSDTGDPTCSAPNALVVGPNVVSIAAGPSMFDATCGGLGAETLYSFTAEFAGSYSFELSGAEFAGGVLYLLDTQCAPIFEACELTIDLVVDETVFLVVDSDSGVGAATVTLTGP